MNLRKIDTSSRILKILKLLASKPRSMNELCRALDYEIYPETISKYFATLRKHGFVIEKRRHKFELMSTPLFIDFDNNELEVMAKLENMAMEINSAKSYEKVKSSISKILKFSPNDNLLLYDKILKSIDKTKIYDKYKDKIEKLSIYTEDGSSNKLKLKYKNSCHIVTALSLKYSANKVYLLGFDEENLVNREFLLDDISEITNFPNGFSKMPFAQKTIFRLSGRVARGYKSPYDFEVITYESDDSILVSNSYEDKDVLMKRLLKYFNYCEIISPKSTREEFIQLIYNMIKNYS